MKTGFIKLYRGLEEHALWLNEPFTKGQAWVDLLLLTNHKPGYITLRNGEMLLIKRGECGWSMEKLAKRWQWSRGKVKRFFLLLFELKMIQQTDIPKATVIKLCNYERFQNDTTNGHQTIQQTDTNKNDKNEKNNTTTILEKIENQKIFGKYQNVCLSAEQYNRLLGICASQKLLDELVDSLSENIEEGREKPFQADFPNSHYIRLTKYYDYRRKYPEKFIGKTTSAKSKTKQNRDYFNAIDEWMQEQRQAQQIESEDR